MCHFCSKRVYVMERLSAEGYFFHRECFRCDVCSSTLRLGGHAYNSKQDKFYCKLHYSQRRPRLQSSNKFQRRTKDQGHLTSSPDGSDPNSTTGSLQSQPPGTLCSFLRRSLRWPLHAGQSVCGTPHRLACWVHGAVSQAGHHLRDRSEDYGFLYELLSLGLPLLSMLHELLGQIYMEAEQPEPQPQGPLPWAQ
ncbi:unnamed protein product [Oncorhynchus mykiss]|uniref:LIM zinc-binding domain-containing protein n=1 Tax=Oncorhynchus mykiss TaxID=8022 RepID=A0A060XIX5_ONCMY|nr:unnamed protein product [Oncorhynchus mykiss]